MLTAVENRDADLLFDEGGPLDVTCDRCHQRYWYPGDTTLARISERENRSAPAETDRPAAPPREVPPVSAAPDNGSGRFRRVVRPAPSGDMSG